MNYEFNWMVVLTGEYRDWIVQGLIVTLKISGVSIVLSFLLGTLVTTLRMTKIRVIEWTMLSLSSSSGTPRCWSRSSSGISALP